MAHAQQSPVTAGAYAIGRGPGVSGYTSLLCSAGQLAVGQAGAPICRTVSGDWTLNAAGVSTLATVNANVGAFGSATNCATFTVNAKGLITAASQTTCTPAIGSVTGLGANIATWLGTPSSANLRAALTDETGTGLPYFQGGDIGTPSAGVATNITGLNATQLTTGTVPPARLGLGQCSRTSLGADANMGSTGVYVDGPSIAQGATGTWWVSGSVTLLDTAALATFNCKLWDGTTVISSGAATTQAANLPYVMTLSGSLATPAGNLRISCADTNGVPVGRIKFNSSGNSKDSTISAFRIN
jgi:hypothetical protein